MNYVRIVLLLNTTASFLLLIMTLSVSNIRAALPHENIKLSPSSSATDDTFYGQQHAENPFPSPDLIILAITLTLSLKVPKDANGTAIGTNMCNAQQSFAARRMDDSVETACKRMCDVIGEFWYRDLVRRILPKTFRKGFSDGIYECKHQLQTILEGIDAELEYDDFGNAFALFLVTLNRSDWKESRQYNARMRKVPNRMFGLILYDRIYGTFQGLLEQQMNIENGDIDRKEITTFSLKWLSLMRKIISVRYEIELAEFHQLMAEGKWRMEERVRRAERTMQEKKEQRNRAFQREIELITYRPDREEKGERHLAELIDLERSQRELAQTVEEAIEYGWKVALAQVNMIGGAGRSAMDRLVREQIKLSLLNNTELLLIGEYNSVLPPHHSANTDFHKFVLTEFLKQNSVISSHERNLIDARMYFIHFLTNFGFRNIEAKLNEICADEEQSWYGMAMMRTVRMCKADMEDEVRLFRKYGLYLSGMKLAKFAEETNAKIAQIGAILLYQHIYNALLKQYLSAEQGNINTTPNSFNKWMSPEEYSGYWLQQMLDSLYQKLGEQKREIAKIFRAQKLELTEMMKREKEEEEEKWHTVMHKEEGREKGAWPRRVLYPSRKRKGEEHRETEMRQDRGEREYQIRKLMELIDQLIDQAEMGQEARRAGRN